MSSSKSTSSGISAGHPRASSLSAANRVWYSASLSSISSRPILARRTNCSRSLSISILLPVLHDENPSSAGALDLGETLLCVRLISCARIGVPRAHDWHTNLQPEASFDPVDHRQRCSAVRRDYPCIAQSATHL